MNTQEELNTTEIWFQSTSVSMRTMLHGWVERASGNVRNCMKLNHTSSALWARNKTVAKDGKNSDWLRQLRRRWGDVSSYAVFRTSANQLLLTIPQQISQQLVDLGHWRITRLLGFPTFVYLNSVSHSIYRLAPFVFVGVNPPITVLCLQIKLLLLSRFNIETRLLEAVT